MSVKCPYCNDEQKPRGLKNHVRLMGGNGHGPVNDVPSGFENDNPKADNREGDASAPYAGFDPEIRSEILKRDGEKCRLCDAETDLQIHHIVKAREGGAHSPENLITLCRPCHRSMESLSAERQKRIYAKSS